MYYIQLQSEYHPLETIDEFKTLKESKNMLKEYILVGGGRYYISTRACKDWEDKHINLGRSI